MKMTMSQLRLSYSMHEMYETLDLNAFGDAMVDINVTPVMPPPPPEEEEEAASDVGYISSVGDRLSATTAMRSIEVTIGGGSTMRKSVSMASLPSEAERKKNFSLLTMVPDMHTVEENDEDDEESMGDDDCCLDNCLDKPVRRTKKCNDPKAIQGGSLRSSLKSSLPSSTSITSDVSEEASQQSMKRNVSFSNLEIRSYSVTLGNHPTLNGPPISLDWKYDPQATQVHDVEEYEQHRSVTPANPTPSNPRRSKNELFIQPFDRQYLLMRDAGFSRVQIKNATEEAQRAAKERQKSAKSRRRLSLDDMLEKASDKYLSWQQQSQLLLLHRQKYLDNTRAR